MERDVVVFCPLRKATYKRFEWDEDKNRTNKIKHHLSFETAKGVFADPLHRSIPDRIEDGE